ncbi:MAG: Trk system potassium transporter TrkA [Deltaproteobacteria bacterium]|nr:Trk system potassium transporter TrkA [Deltaproteobacteria bacterium]
MYIVVIGLGQVGRHVIRKLEAERHDVVAIDMDKEAIDDVAEHHDIATLQGYGANPRVLREARVGEADLVVAVTDSDEVNFIAALASRQFGAKKVIARVQDSAFLDTEDGVQYGLLGVDVVINPQVLLAREIAKIARSHGALEVIDLANDRIEVVKMIMADKSRMLHKPLAKLPLPPNVLIAAVVRDGELFIPGGADVLLPEDRVYIAGLPEDVQAAEDLFTRRREAHRVVIVGGGVVGEALARDLLRDKATVLIIERRAARARQLAEELEGATIVHGDGTQLQILEEEKVGTYDLFVAVSHEDEVNLMAGLLAKRAGADRTVVLAHRPDYTEIYRQLGIDVVLSPRVVASDHILRWARKTELQSLTVLEDGQAEVLEFVATANSRVVGTSLRRLNLPRGTLLVAIVHGDEVIIPRGDSEVQPGDSVLVFTTTATKQNLARLFGTKLL